MNDRTEYKIGGLTFVVTPAIHVVKPEVAPKHAGLAPSPPCSPSRGHFTGAAFYDNRAEDYLSNGLTPPSERGVLRQHHRVTIHRGDVPETIPDDKPLTPVGWAVLLGLWVIFCVIPFTVLWRYGLQVLGG